MKDAADEHDITLLEPREKPKVEEWIAEIQQCFHDCYGIDVFERMEHNRRSRMCQWDGQSWSGRKDVLPDADPEAHKQIFPWPGAADNRVPALDEIIVERVAVKMVAGTRAETRVIPRGLHTDADRGRDAAAWSLVNDYYHDLAGDEMRRQRKRWTDIAEEFGHSVMFLSWQLEHQVEKREIGVDDLVRVFQAAAIATATARAIEELEAAGEQVPVDPETQRPAPLDDETIAELMAAAETDVEQLVEQSGMRKELVRQLQLLDPDMTNEEASHVAGRIKQGEPVQYYAPYVSDSRPEWRALVPWVDVFYPPHTKRLERARWIAMTEWVDAVTLRERIASQGYSESWVEEVLENPGRAVDFRETRYANTSWLLGGANVLSGVNFTPEGEPYGAATEDAEEWNQKHYQIIHLYYRATTQQGVPALYRTVLHGFAGSEAGLHECQPDAHGEYPFVVNMREPESAYVAASRGVGEISFTQQDQIKRQTDLRDDFASLTVQPPLLVPMNMAGGHIDVRPGRQIGKRLTAAAGGGYEWMKPAGDAGPSIQVEETARMALNYRWFRGPEVEPDVKAAVRQEMVDDYFMDLRTVMLRTFQLVQEYAPDEIKGNVGGRPVSATRKELQGQVAIDMEFDVTDLDFELVGKKLELLNKGLRPLDTEGILPVKEILLVAARALLPNWHGLLDREPATISIEEREEELSVLNSLLVGQERDYTMGKNHALRLQVLEQAVQTPAVMRAIAEDDEAGGNVRELIENRIKFHRFQVEQHQINPVVGQTGVNPVTGQVTG